MTHRWALILTLVFLAVWAPVGAHEVQVARRRASETTAFLPDPGGEPSCAMRRGISLATSAWIDDAAARAAGWSIPPHLDGLPTDRTPVEYVETSRGALVFVQAGASEQEPEGFPYWLALLAPGDVEEHHVPRIGAQRELLALSPFAGELGDAFFLASEGDGGTLGKLDPVSLDTVRLRTNVAPRPAGTPALSYFTPDGQGGLFFASYGDVGARVHHVDRNLDDVVPARFFTVPAPPSQHWNPRALGVTPDRVCVELDRFDPTLHPGSQGCGRRFLVLDHAFEPAVTSPVNLGRDGVRTRVAGLGGLGLLAWLCALAVLAHVRRAQRALAGATEAQVLDVTVDAVRIRTATGVATVPRARLRVILGGLRPGPCVIDPGAVTASSGYRGDVVALPARRLVVATGAMAEVLARAPRWAWRVGTLACMTQALLVGLALVARA